MKNFKLPQQIIFLLLVSLKSSFAQVLSADANGKSTILVEGGNLSIDPGKTSAEINYTQFANYFKRKTFRKLVWGGNVRGEANGGISDIISGGNVESKSRLNMFVGFTNYFNDSNCSSKDHKGNPMNFKPSALYTELLKEFEKQKAKKEKENNERGLILEGRTRLAIREVNKAINDFLDEQSDFKLKTEFKSFLKTIEKKAFFVQQRNQFGLIETNQYTLADSLIERDFKPKYKSLILLIKNVGSLNKIPEKLSFVTKQDFDTFQTTTDDGTGIKEYSEFQYLVSIALFEYVKKKFDAFMDTNIKPLNEEFNTMEIELTNLENKMDSLNIFWSRRGILYFRGGVEGNQFKLFETIDTSNVYSTNKKKKFSGFNAEIGYNYHTGGNYLLGVSVGYQSVSNFSDLKKQEVSITEKGKDKLGQEITRVEKIEAFYGNYGTYERVNINLDLIKFVKFNNKYFVTINPWLRHKIPSTFSLARTSTDLGISLYIFKNEGFFMGGLYSGITDVSDSQRMIKGNKPINPGQRWNFGIVTKFNFMTILGI